MEKRNLIVINSLYLRLSLSFLAQVSIASISYDEIHDIYGEVVSRGLSGDSLKKLPCHVILDDIMATQGIYCTICLQVLLCVNYLLLPL